MPYRNRASPPTKPNTIGTKSIASPQEMIKRKGVKKISQQISHVKAMEKVPLEESIRLIYPRLTVLVTTANPAREVNAAPYSWIAPVSFSPPMLYLGIQRRETLTVKNIRRGKEFVVNVVTRDWAEKAVSCGAKLPDKVERSGLEFEEGKKVSVPCVKGAKIVLECRLKDIIESGQADHFLILGEIVHAEKEPGLEDEDIAMHISGETFVGPGKRFQVEGKK